MAYIEVKKVRAVNGQQFIDDFKSIHTVMAYASSSKLFLEVPRWRVWEDAKTQKIKYFVTTEIFKNERKVIVIV